MENKEINIFDILKKDTVHLDHDAFDSKDELFRFMASKFNQADVINDDEEYIKALYYRESIGSTFMGNGIALPHGKASCVHESSIGFCRLSKPFKYESYGEKGEVDLVFMIAIQEDASNDSYMRILANLARLLAHEEVIDIFRVSESYEEIIRKIQEFNESRN